MSEAKFTKGPWRRNYHANGCQYISAKTGLNGCYSVASLSGPEDVANANLIAAAPEMYLKLESISSYLNEDGLSVTGLAKEIAEIRDLLAKARGEA